MADTRRRVTDEDLAGLRKAADAGIIGARLRGKAVCFTGKMSMRREDMQKLARVCGARVEDKPRGWHGILVVGDTGIHGRTSKVREADALRWQVITEAEFVQLATQPEQ